MRTPARERRGGESLDCQEGMRLTIGPIRRPERRRTKRIGQKHELSELAMAFSILAVVAAVMMAF